MGKAKDVYYKGLHSSCCEYAETYTKELEQTLTDARKFIQYIYDNTDPCTCPAEGDCVCGQTELLKIMKKIDEVIG